MFALLLVTASLQQDVSIQAEYAWGGRYRPHFWAPVRISVENPGKLVEGTLKLRWAWPGANPTGAAKRVRDIGEGGGPMYEIPVALPERSRRVYTGYVRAPQGMSLWVGFEPMEGRPSRPFEVFALPAAFGKPFVAVVGKGVPAGLRDAARGSIEIAVASPDALPDRWVGYAPVDVLVWTEGDAGELRDPRQGEALKHWIAGGGHLVVARSHLAGIAGTELEELLPLEAAAPVQAVISPDLGALPGHAAFLRGRLRPGAQALIPDSVYRWNYGRGRVTLIGFDPSSEPFRSSELMRDLWDRLLEPKVMYEGQWSEWNLVDNLGATLGSTALADLAFQLPGVQAPSLAWLFCIILVYVILVGPVDYFMLRRLRRQELTWVTFPVCVIGFLAITATAAGKSVRRFALAREVAIVDVIPEVGITRTVSIGSLLTPFSELVILESDRPNGTIVPLVSGGKRHGWNERTLERVRIVQSDLIRAAELPIAAGATTVSLLERVEPGPGGITFQFVGEKLIVQNDAGAHVRDAWLLTPDGAMKVGELAPGRTERSDLRWTTFPGEKVSLRELGGLDPSDRELGGLDPSELMYGRRTGESDPEGLEASIRRLLLGLTRSSSREPPAFLSGPARDIDVRPWLEDGGMALVGWLESGGSIKYRNLEPERSAVVLVRVFSK